MENTAQSQSNVDQIKAERAALEAQIAELKAQQADLLKAQRQEFRLKVSDKGAVSIYGFGRFPVSLYPNQIEKLLSHAEEIKAFVMANKAKLDAIAKAKDQE